MKRLWLVTLLVWAGAVQAHIASNGFVVADVKGQELSGSVELAVRDVELAVGVDTNHDGKVTWGEIRANAPQLLQYIGQHLLLSAQDSACVLNLGAAQINDRVDGSYVWLPFTAHCPAAVQRLSIRYSMMDDIDPSHRGLLTLTAGPLTDCVPCTTRKERGGSTRFGRHIEWPHSGGLKSAKRPARSGSIWGIGSWKKSRLSWGD